MDLLEKGEENMYQYSVADWILLFFIYGFFGWIFETTYVSIRKRKFVNRGFLRGPILPIYASGAIIMLFASIPFEGNLIATYFAGMVAATFLELVVGLAMESIFKVKYWDYSNQKFQFKGVICLSSSIAWGFLTLFLTEVIHKPIERVLFQIPHVLEYVLVAVISVVFVSDTIASVKAALDLRKMLEKMTAMRKELEEMQEEFLEMAAEKKEVLLKAASQKKERFIERIEDYKEEILENAPDKLESYYHLKDKLEEYREYSKNYGILKAELLKAHPSASSMKYKEALRDIRKYIEEDLKTKKNKLKNKKMED